jgi:Co/Zn/Cd efflux system component
MKIENISITGIDSSKSIPCICCTNWTQQSQQTIWKVLYFTIGSAVLELLIESWHHSHLLFLEAQHLAIDSGILCCLLFFDRLVAYFPRWNKQHIQSIAALINALALSICTLQSTLATWISPTVHWTTTHWSIPLAALIGAIGSYSSLQLLQQTQLPDLNRRSIALHLQSDLIGAIGTILLTAANAMFHQVWIDSFGSLLITLTILSHALSLALSSYQQLTLKPSRSTPVAALGADGQFHSLTELVLASK